MSILSSGDDSLVEELIDILREDREMLEEVETNGVVKTILKMTKQSSLDGWRMGINEKLTIFPGDKAGSEVKQNEAEEDMTDEVM